jgi:NAD(P)-dependent dehydrogenase (short-subunit alcohol dehydrogenase family)
MQQRHILITGAGSGLGAATARVLARQGHRLALVGRRLQPLRELETSLADTGAQVRALSCDVSDAEAIRRLFDGFGDDAPDGVVCSAAELLIKPFLETTLDEYDRVMAVNVRGIWYLCQQAFRVNCVAPGYMQTEMNERIGVSRGAGPDDVAPSIAFLLDRAQSGPTSGTTLEIFCNGS